MQRDINKYGCGIYDDMPALKTSYYTAVVAMNGNLLWIHRKSGICCKYISNSGIFPMLLSVCRKGCLTDAQTRYKYANYTGRASVKTSMSAYK